MYYRKTKTILLILALFLITGIAQAVPVLDGSMGADWGTHYTDGEETNGGSDSYVEPGYGGQQFDVEKIGLQFDNGNVYFGLQTGFNFVGGVSYGGQYYTAGDIFIDFGSDHVWDLAIGVNNFMVSTVGALSIPTFSDSLPFTNTGGVNLGTASGVHGTLGTNTFGETIYSLEGVFNLDALGLGDLYGQSAIIHWTMSCGNDVLEHPESAPVPEPATLFLLGTGLMGIAGLKRKIKK